MGYVFVLLKLTRDLQESIKWLTLLGVRIIWSKAGFQLLQHLLNQITFETSNKGDCEACAKAQFLTTAQWEPLQLVWVSAAALHTPLMELVLWTDASAEDLAGFFFSLHKVGIWEDLWTHFEFSFQMAYAAIQYSSSLCYLSFYL